MDGQGSIINRAPRSRLLSWIQDRGPTDFVDVVQTEPISYFNHHRGLTRSTYDSLVEGDTTNTTTIMRLADLIVVATSRSKQDVEIVSFLEHRFFPVYASQFHPEKNLYEWNERKSIPHTSFSGEFAQLLGNFFVEEARKSPHSFREDEDLGLLVWNHPITPLGHRSDFDAVFMFPKNPTDPFPYTLKQQKG